jgi:hypothetical protein
MPNNRGGSSKSLRDRRFFHFSIRDNPPLQKIAKFTERNGTIVMVAIHAPARRNSPSQRLGYSKALIHSMSICGYEIISLREN